jgi:hypothetical protein
MVPESSVPSHKSSQLVSTFTHLIYSTSILIFLRSILILSCHLYLGLTIGLFHVSYPNSIYIPMHATWLAHHILDSASFLQFLPVSYSSSPLSTLYSNILNPHCFLNMKNLQCNVNDILKDSLNTTYHKLI